MAHLQRLIALAALLLAFLPQSAAAQVVTRTQAYANCEASRAFADAVPGYTPDLIVYPCTETVTGSNQGYFKCEYNWPALGSARYGCSNWEPQAKTFHYYNAPGAICEAGQTVTGWGSSWEWPPSGTRCNSSNCAVTETISSAPVPQTVYRDGVPTTLYNYFGTATTTGATCGEGPEGPGETPPGDDEGQPDGDGWKCNPESGLCTDPDGNGKLCSFNPDGTRSACVDYKPGDGTDPAPEDEEQPNDPRDNPTASGGATCTQAPACTSKNPIECAMLWQQWKTRCALEKEGTVSNASCVNGVPTTLNCANVDAAECFRIQKQHETACFLSVSGTSDDGQLIEPGDMGNASDFGDSAYASGAGTAEGSAGAWRPSPGSGDGPEFDDSGWLSGRTCPVLPVVATSIMGNPISLDFNSPDLCWWLSLGSQLVLVFAALASIRIYSKVI